MLVFVLFIVIFLLLLLFFFRNISKEVTGVFLVCAGISISLILGFITLGIPSGPEDTAKTISSPNAGIQSYGVHKISYIE